VAADPANVDAHYSLIQVCRKLGRTDDAEGIEVFEALRASQRRSQGEFGRGRYDDTSSQPNPASPKAPRMSGERRMRTEYGELNWPAAILTPDSRLIRLSWPRAETQPHYATPDAL
jgi:hypothetical protein